MIFSSLNDSINDATTVGDRLFVSRKSNSTRLRWALVQLYFPENRQQCSGCPMEKDCDERDCAGLPP